MATRDVAILYGLYDLYDLYDLGYVAGWVSSLFTVVRDS